MKKLAFILMAATVMVSCKKSEVSNETPPLTSPGMTAKISGTAINFGEPMAEKQMSTDGTETVFVSGYTTDGKSIDLSLSKAGGIAVGSYSAANFAVVGFSDGTTYYGTTNTVNIKVTTIDATHIVGTFSGTAEDANGTNATKLITEGKFYANF